MSAQQRPVALVSMPTLSARFPSFQLGLLQPMLEREGIPAQPFSMFMYFGTHIGFRINEVISEVYPCMVGEWIWARQAFGAFADDDAYFRAYERNFRTICRLAGCTMDELVRIRDHATKSFLDFCVESVDWSRFGLVGFTVVFQQLAASIALAKALKARHPGLPVIMGGASFEDDIAEGVMAGCPEVDYIHCGDAELTLPEVVRRIYAGEPLRGQRGIMWRDRGQLAYEGRAPNLTDMDRTPVPSFDEYFYARRESGYDAHPGAKEAMIPIETARGCWWGMKHHCTFCGLNRAGMDFRAKSADSVLAMIKDLSRRYGIRHYNAIDNIIAPEYVDDLFGKLAEARTDVRLHYEIRPSISRDKLKKMRMGGLYSVQPGVESFSTHVLKLMKKHTTGVRNLELVKWCTYYGINNLYNILVRFAGETAEDYALQCGVIARIHHYQPPYGIVKARADRGSPMFEEPVLNRVHRLAPSPCYAFIFPEDRFDLRKVSYYFEHETADAVPDQQYDEIFARVAEWQDLWKGRARPLLRYEKTWDTLTIEDGRRGASRRTRLTDGRAELYEHCADARSRAAIDERFDGATWVGEALDELVADDLMIHLDDRYLSLALPENPYW